jgi:hypothetical protein
MSVASLGVYDVNDPELWELQVRLAREERLERARRAARDLVPGFFTVPRALLERTIDG